MRNKAATGLVIFLLSYGASAGFAGAILGSGSFQPFPSSLNEDGNPYWDNPSLDGAQKNVGFILSGMGTTPAWWGNSNGSADSNFAFEANSGFTATLTLELAGQRNGNEFGWYRVTSPNVLMPIFLGAASPVSVTFVEPQGSYGFYLRTESGRTYYTQSGLQSGSENSAQHFALFGESLATGYWIGVEDLPSNSTRERKGDFNDMIVRLTSPVPEPSTMTMFLIAAGAFAFRRLRIKR